MLHAFATISFWPWIMTQVVLEENFMSSLQRNYSKDNYQILWNEINNFWSMWKPKLDKFKAIKQLGLIYSKSPQSLKEESSGTFRYLQELEGTLKSSKELSRAPRNLQELPGTRRNYQELQKFMTIYHTGNQTCVPGKHTTARRRHFQLLGYLPHK